MKNVTELKTYLQISGFQTQSRNNIQDFEISWKSSTNAHINIEVTLIFGVVRVVAVVEVLVLEDISTSEVSFFDKKRYNNHNYTSWRDRFEYS